MTQLEEFLALPSEKRRIGSFHILQPLGKGTSAPVWLAAQRVGSTTIHLAAIKLFALSSGRAEGAARGGQRIADEARALENARHPNVVSFYSVVTDDERGIMGIAMEYVEGTPLDKYLRPDRETRRLLSLQDTLEVGIAVASALSAAHQVNVIVQR